ncbi:MAG: bifunctional heptose 7-phosphate kinase/heptose 1-phosphate adenyltransferase [Candidatus Thorarchaeota archaeon]|jgi:D-beta-D-heptose 7-phosphate kinase/D-beta-D-heptose 1-phosphate adenosyltransferase
MRVLLIGDLMMDEYVYGEAAGISPEAPILLVKKKKVKRHTGGAANVKHNLEALGVEVDFLCDDMTISTKTRVVVQGQAVIRIDNDKIGKPPKWCSNKDLENRIKVADIVMISDYGKGVVTEELMGAVSMIAKTRGKKLLVDPYPGRSDYGNDVTLITPNLKEVESVVRRKVKWDSLVDDARDYMRKTKTRNLLITLGKDGMVFFDWGNYKHNYLRVEAKKKRVVDVTGAGDTVFAIMGYIWAQEQFSKSTSVRYANKAAGIVVGKFGCATVTKEEVFEWRWSRY